MFSVLPEIEVNQYSSIAFVEALVSCTSLHRQVEHSPTAPLHFVTLRNVTTTAEGISL